MGYRLRLVDQTDETTRDRLNDLDKQLFPNDVLSNKEGWWWLVFQKGRQEPVAFAGMQPSANYDDCVYLCRVGVIPLHRGNRLQRRLILARERKTRELGYRYAITDTSLNIASANSLIACRYKLYEPSHPWAFSGSLYWRRAL